MGRVYDLAQVIHLRLQEKRRKDKREKILLAVIAMIMTAAAGAATTLYMDAEGKLNYRGEGITVAYDPACHGMTFSKAENTQSMLTRVFGR